MLINQYKPGDVIYFREGRVSWPGKVLPSKQVVIVDEESDGLEYETVYPVLNLRNGSISEPRFGWKTEEEYSRYLSEGKIKIGEKKEKVAAV